MARPADNQIPPKFEISDLSIQLGNPLYPGAVRCVQAYWKQATSMTPDQRDQYLLYLQSMDQRDSFVEPLLGENVTSLVMFQRFCSLSDGFPSKRLSWPAYLFLSAWYVYLPTEYIAKIENLHGTSLIQDHTAKYRSIYPAPPEVPWKPEVVEAIVSSQQPNAIAPIMKNCSVAPASTQKQNGALEQQTDNVASTSSGNQPKSTAAKKKKDNKSPAPTCQQQNDTPTKNKDPATPAATKQQHATPKQEKPTVVRASANIQQQNVAPAHGNNEQTLASTSKQENTTSAVVELPPATPTTPQSVGAESWNIDNVVGILSESKKKRLLSPAESSLKRTRVNDNQQATITKSALEKLQSTVEDQGAKLQEACAAAEQNKQTLDSMQSELRQFMSAVASTLRDIKDHLEE
ncbi:hypothetical protein T069G_08094 [Trichoderma breve]|uniref:Uncharacterized protein n=1 Tax=Trichoderma breve TaxID=2034170 RepID=A0A9W9E5C9_9HYPO|nr:hypothetical protein T069G_08094 [Trichoderma breve]KAJ4857197.1 hypothetical protein T069G_08094 [Trichoderma breve]